MRRLMEVIALGPGSTSAAGDAPLQARRHRGGLRAVRPPARRRAEGRDHALTAHVRWAAAGASGRKSTTQTWHAVDAGRRRRCLRPRPVASSADETARRRVTFGPNRWPKPGVPLWRFLQQFRNPLIYALLTAGMISAGIGPAPALVILWSTEFRRHLAEDRQPDAQDHRAASVATAFNTGANTWSGLAQRLEAARLLSRAAIFDFSFGRAASHRGRPRERLLGVWQGR